MPSTKSPFLKQIPIKFLIKLMKKYGLAAEK
jgi:hypothetical protein